MHIIDPNRPIKASVSLVFQDGTPYAPASSPARAGEARQDRPAVREAPPAIGRAVSAAVAVVPPPVIPASTGGVKVLFEFGGHAVTATFNEVSTSVGVTHLVFDVTGRDDAFLPFHAHLRPNTPPTEEVVSALPSGGTTAFLLAVKDSPPIAIQVAGRKVYLVPVVETAEIPPSEQATFVAATATAPSYEARHDQERGDRTDHPLRPDRPPVDTDEEFELILPGEDAGTDPDRGQNRGDIALSSVLV